MKRLTPEQFARARGFLKTQARPLDRALFEHRFEAAPAGQAVAKLAQYRNADGGLGHALEPDLRTPSSSALCTGIGLRVLHEVGCASDHPLVSGAVQFLLEAFDEEKRVWPATPHDANEHPHAPWWHDDDGSLARTFDEFVIIPRAQIVGLLHRYADLVPSAWLDAVTADTVVTIEALEDDAFAGGGDALRYALDLAETEPLPQHLKDRLIPRLRSHADRIVCRDPGEWGEYCPTPLKIAPSPRSVVADLLRDELGAHLDYAIGQQTAQGTWEPSWTWGDFYPQVWKQAELEWRGHLTLETLTSLHAFGHIEM
jgi:hypothetical protein